MKWWQFYELKFNLSFKLMYIFKKGFEQLTQIPNSKMVGLLSSKSQKVTHCGVATSGVWNYIKKTQIHQKGLKFGISWTYNCQQNMPPTGGILEIGNPNAFGDAAVHWTLQVGQ